MLENAKPEDQDAALLAIVITLLHEENHRGRSLSKTEYIPPSKDDTREEGDAFVWEVYGKDTPEAWNDVTGQDWESTILQGAKKIIETKSRNNEDRKDLPAMSWSQIGGIIAGWLKENPGINYKAKL